MDRHAFLRSQEWLDPLPQAPCHDDNAHATSPGDAAVAQRTSPRQPPSGASATAFVGAASFHISPREQNEDPKMYGYEGPMAPDALHLQFAVNSQARDPMQLWLAVNIMEQRPASGETATATAAGEQEQQPYVALELDGSSYRLSIRHAIRLVVPQQVGGLVPAALLSRHPHRCAFLETALQPSSLPYLTLIFPHVCLNLYPLGWKTAAGHISKEHDVAEMVRLTQLLVECWDQERQHAVPPQQAGSSDWTATQHSLLQNLQDMSAAASQLLSSNGADSVPAAAQQAAWHALAASAEALQHHRHALVAACPA